MEQNHNMLRGISENGGIVFYGVDSTEIVREMERLHKTSAVTTAALGRLLTAASMMGIMLKSTQDSVTLQIKGGGGDGALAAALDNYAEPEEVALTNLQLDKAIALLDEMPLIYRQTLVLCVKGYSIREIAKITDSSESNVKTRIHRARAMLLKSFVEQAE